MYDDVRNGGVFEMSGVQVMRKDALPEGAASPGISRQRALDGEGVQVLRSRSDPGVVSGWHTHGDYDVFGYVVSGTARLESGPAGRDGVSASAGDFLFVPANTVHREINPSATEKVEVILFLRGTGPTVFNVENPEPA
jgi:quercetin dioxygenase-like cupin family protein